MHYSHVAGQLAVQVFDGVCRSQHAGHSPHLIQLRKALGDEREPVAIIPQTDEGCVSLSNQGATASFFNHHSNVIYELSQLHRGSRLEYVERFGILLLRVSEDEGFAFSLSKEALTTCVD